MNNHPLTIRELIDQQAELRPSQLFLINPETGNQVAFGDLQRQVRRLGTRFLELGLKPGDKVAFLMDNGLTTVELFLGTMYAGLVSVPLNVRAGAAALSYTLEHCDAAVVFVDEAYRGLLTEVLTAVKRPVHTVSAPAESWAETAETPRPALPPPAPTDLALLMYSSGSTGQPKAAMHTHQTLLVHGQNSIQAHQLTAADCSLLVLPLYHINAECVTLMPTLLTGGTVVVPQHFSVSQFWDWLAEHRCTWSAVVPTIISQLLDWQDPKAGQRAAAFQRIRFLRSSSAPLSPALHREFLDKFKLPLLQAMGSTEGGNIFSNPPPPAPNKLGSPGLAWGFETRIIDRQGLDVAPGEPGEVLIRGPGLMQGYYKDAVGTAAVLDTAGWFHTGDLAYQDQDGYFFVVGRSKELIIKGGMNIAPKQIDEVLEAHPTVLEAAAVGVPDRYVGEDVVAFAVLRSGMTGDERALLSFCESRLGHFKTPTRIHFVTDLPKGPSGKIQRRRLVEEATRPEFARSTSLETSPAPANTPRPLTPPEGGWGPLIAEIWRELLHQRNIQEHDNFFGLGGHSLLAIQCLSRMREQVPVRLSLADFFEHSTVAGLAALVVQRLRVGPPLAEDASAPAAKETGPIPPRDRTQPCPLSPAQKRIWFFEKLLPDVPLYNESEAVRLTGELQELMLEKALNGVIARHEILRSVIQVKDGQPEVWARDHWELKLKTVDLSGWESARQRAETERLLVEEPRLPYHLHTEPGIRATLVRLGAQEHVFILMMHHLVCDWSSEGVLWRELSASYHALVGGQLPVLSDLPIQYGDYAVWQGQQLHDANLAADLAYWEANLRGAPDLLELPTDRPRPTVNTHRGARQRFRLGAPLVAALRECSRQEKVSLFTLFVAAWDVLLHRYSGQEDISLGIPLADRDRPESQSAIGFLLHTHVLRTQLSGELSFRELLPRVQKGVLDLYAHRAAPFDQVVARIKPERNLSYAPLFQVMINWRDREQQLSYIGLDGLVVESMLAESRTAKFDLTLMLTDDGEVVWLEMEYSTDLFDATTIERMMRHYETLLASVAENPQQSIAGLPLLTPAERQQMLVEWNWTDRPYPLDRCLHELIEAQALRTPSATALVCQDQHLTYLELIGRANQLARFLQRAGVGAGTLVGICAERSVEMVVGLLGILKAGATYVPLDPEYPADRLAFMAEDANVPVLLTQNSVAHVIPAGHARVIRLDEDWPSIATESSAAPAHGATTQDAAYMIYTSGSTGRPKGVLNTHAGIVNRLLWMQEAYHLTAADRVLQKTPFSFDVSVWEFFWPLLAGATLVLARPGGHKDGRYLAEIIGREKITTLHFVPSMLSAFLEQDGLSSACASLKRVFCSGEVLSYELQERFFSRLAADLHNLYGPTEAAVDVTYWTCQRGGVLRTVPIGKPIANTQLYILDRNLQPAPIGVPGELHLGGIGLARGYHNRPELTAEKFIPNPFSPDPGARLYKTGDLVRYLPDGNVEYLGRLDHQIKIRGFRVELGEIEAQLNQHPTVREAVVLAAGDTLESRRLVAYVTPRGQQVPKAAELREWLLTKLPEHMVPAAFVTLAQFPLTPNGKVDRKALPAFEVQRPELAAAYVPPGSRVERILADLWGRALGLEKVGIHDRFFDLGGHSLLMVKVQTEIRRALGCDLPIADLFRFPTVALLARHLERPPTGENSVQETRDRVRRQRKSRTSRQSASGRYPIVANANSDQIAIIGLDGRFPGAANLDEYWSNLAAGRETVSVFTDEELAASGIDVAAVRQTSGYVPARAILQKADWFDAVFFGMHAKQAEVTDPQQRLFLETAWTALENAGYDPERIAGSVGVYGGMGGPSYYLKNLQSHPDLIDTVGERMVNIGNSREYLATLVAYKLNLRGPAVNINTACSTSLVAVCQACQSLLNYQCDMALAGGVSLTFPQRSGVRYQEAGIFSPDGHCRPFDAQAQGTVSGEGVGIVVLKRLAEALQDGDQIQAVIKGFGLNNDGSVKVSFTAPSVDGQAEAIAMAWEQAGFDPETISYVEAHGTATPIGDPIEIAALTQVFRANTARTGFCALGSVKGNIGHADAAAGVAGLIKTVLALKHRLLPPSLNFTVPNPKIDLASSPFYVNTKLTEWPAQATPRRAGVSSFGLGGTNAHVVLEEAPPQSPASASRPWQLLLLSAKTVPALEAASANLLAHLRANPEASLPDTAFTLQQGRQVFEHRQMLVCRNAAEAVEALATRDSRRVFRHDGQRQNPPVVFMFPGQGAQHIDMGAELYRTEAVFQREIDRCSEILRPKLGVDLRRILYPPPETAAEAAGSLRQTQFTQPALFTTEFALATLWMSWGVKPTLMIGHSIGEYVAACLAGVFTLEDALELVAQRGKLMQSMPPGAMLAVPRPEAELQKILPPTLSLATVNGPSQCVVSGPTADINEFEAVLSKRGIAGTVLHTSHAFHSAMMEPILEPFAECVSRVQRSAPQIPFASNVTGACITESDARDPHYWAKQLRHAVRFADAIRDLPGDADALLLEVGPGTTLSSLARLAPTAKPGRAIFASLHQVREQRSDLACLLTALGQLWLHGVTVDWTAFYSSEIRQRTPLPTYPFQRECYRVETGKPEPVRSSPQIVSRKDPMVADWFYVPSWRRSFLRPPPAAAQGQDWLIFLDEGGLGADLARKLAAYSQRVTLVRQGNAFEEFSESDFAINPAAGTDYQHLVEELERRGRSPKSIVHLWTVSSEKPSTTSATECLEQHRRLGFESLQLLAKALGQRRNDARIRINCISSQVQEVSDGDLVIPGKAMLLGPSKVIAQEYDRLVCRCIDVVPSQKVTTGWDRLVTQLATEVLSPATEPVVAYRGRHRWVQAFEPAPLGTDTTVLRERGVYLITGGLGRIGLALAEYLARDFHACLILLDVSAPPPKEEWPAWLKEKGPRDPTSRQIQKLQELESAGGKVMVMAANVADCNGIKAAISAAGERFGALHGIFHGAGITDPSYFKPIADTTTANSDLHFAPKIQGALALDEALRGQPLDFVILWSSLSVILGGPGCSAHAAASHFLDAFALSHPPGERTQWISVDWDDWANVETDPASKVGGNGSEFGLAAAERIAAFQRILSNHGLRQVIVATRDLRLRLERQTESQPVELEAPVPPVDNSLLHSRPEVRTNYVPAQSEAEKLLTGIWEALLGIAKPGVDDNFFDLGGDSLLLMRLQAKLREVFEVDLSSAEMFQYPTIRGLAGRINQPVADSRGLTAVRDRARRQKALLTQSQVTNS